MANLLRTAKSGTDWSQVELHAYNIIVELQDAVTFFGVNPLPQPAVAGELLNNAAADDMVNDANYKLLRYMDLAMDPVPTEESAVDDFAIHLLTLLGYVPRTRMARTRADIPLTIFGQECHAKTDVCIVDSDDILLLVQEDKRHKEPKDPEPQLIAAAIAAFQTNNYRRTRILGQDPIVHKISVTTQLAQSIALGVYPAAPTVVHAHLPAVARPARRLSEGMKPLDNRACILACYEAFKRFIN
ncbi:hypothetical protein M378DRAFT_540003 [Amanita muscaria Koide BX008]|uniref:Uncharacterized protein n=1 Tax=Amanita muscaria (strain Koide BX008) TaxID=946122 RepID=A0A0C2SQ52_AMAMK|nr:hypothetical protein M378DRAFT_540003 [Amanita muscaria Koide BX008]